MEKENYRFIFDMDGTLYRFDKDAGGNFTGSRFYSDVKNSVYGFFEVKLGMNREEAVQEYERIKEKYAGEVSLGVEAEHGIDRYEFFEATWRTLEPADYIEAGESLQAELNTLKGKIALLTAAPRVWAVKVLAYLDIEEAFGMAVYTGEPDVRKPDPRAFGQIVNDFGTDPSVVFSVGDQEKSDIVPARGIGMRTVKIGPGETSADYQAEDLFVALAILRNEGFL